jgi:biopolymer transport protein ExbD
LADINVTPLVDTLLVLLVLLTLVMPLYVRRLPVELPRTGLTGTPMAARTLLVTLGADGRLGLAGTQVQLSDVQAAVNATTSVEIAADAAVPYAHLARLIAALHERGVREVALATR